MWTSGSHRIFSEDLTLVPTLLFPHSQAHDWEAAALSGLLLPDNRPSPTAGPSSSSMGHTTATGGVDASYRLFTLDPRGAAPLAMVVSCTSHS